MVKFNEFLQTAKKQENYSLAAPSSNLIADVITKELTTSPLVHLSSTKASEFSRKISEFATNDEVINDLSNELGLPDNNETEDEFIFRAKLTFSKILKNKLSKIK